MADKEIEFFDKKIRERGKQPRSLGMKTPWEQGFKPFAKNASGHIL
jgi:hypothetical protein